MRERGDKSRSVQDFAWHLGTCLTFYRCFASPLSLLSSLSSFLSLSSFYLSRATAAMSSPMREVTSPHIRRTRGKSAAERGEEEGERGVARVARQKTSMGSLLLPLSLSLYIRVSVSRFVCVYACVYVCERKLWLRFALLALLFFPLKKSCGGRCRREERGGHRRVRCSGRSKEKQRQRRVVSMCECLCVRVCACVCVCECVCGVMARGSCRFVTSFFHRSSRSPRLSSHDNPHPTHTHTDTHTLSLFPLFSARQSTRRRRARRRPSC